MTQQDPPALSPDTCLALYERLAMYMAEFELMCSGARAGTAVRTGSASFPQFCRDYVRWVPGGSRRVLALVRAHAAARDHIERARHHRWLLHRDLLEQQRGKHAEIVAGMFQDLQQRLPGRALPRAWMDMD